MALLKSDNVHTIWTNYLVKKRLVHIIVGSICPSAYISQYKGLNLCLGLAFATLCHLPACVQPHAIASLVPSDLCCLHRTLSSLVPSRSSHMLVLRRPTMFLDRLHLVVHIWCSVLLILIRSHFVHNSWQTNVWLACTPGNGNIWSIGCLVNMIWII
jgi:hypothetical protein